MILYFEGFPGQFDLKLLSDLENSYKKISLVVWWKLTGNLVNRKNLFFHLLYYSEGSHFTKKTSKMRF